MGSFHVPADHAVAHTRGAAAGTAIPVPSIRAADALLAVISHPQAGGQPQGRDVSAFAVSDGAIESASVDTAADFVVVIHTTN